MIKLQVNVDRELKPEREFQPTLQCSSARPPVRGWPLGWRWRGSPEEKQIKHTHTDVLSTDANSNDGKPVERKMVDGLDFCSAFGAPFQHPKRIQPFTNTFINQ